jgi:hypothetical protein
MSRNDRSITTVVARAAEQKNTCTFLELLAKLLGCAAASVFHEN